MADRPLMPKATAVWLVENTSLTFEQIGAMPDVQKVSVALTGEQLGALRAAVETGEYATTTRLFSEAIRDWQFKRELRQENLKRLEAVGPR